jgi:hypothetical protein
MIGDWKICTKKCPIHICMQYALKSSQNMQLNMQNRLTICSYFLGNNIIVTIYVTIYFSIFSIVRFCLRSVNVKLCLYDDLSTWHHVIGANLKLLITEVHMETSSSKLPFKTLLIDFSEFFVFS